MESKRLNILDICNYLVPGYSNDQLLKAYDRTAQKGSLHGVQRRIATHVESDESSEEDVIEQGVGQSKWYDSTMIGPMLISQTKSFDAIHVRCFNHFRDKCKEQLKSSNVSEEAQKELLTDIFGHCIGDTLEKGTFYC